MALILFLSSGKSFCQKDSIDYAAEIAKLEFQMDSMGIFNLFDSVLNLPKVQPTSDLNVRFGYSGNVLTAGRNFGLDQHGISPGISFYHKSGFFADLSGYWNSEFSPSYALTLITAGYLKPLSKNFSLSINYENWFFNLSEEYESAEGINKSFGGSLSFLYNHWFATLDYSYLFGEGSSHRVITALVRQVKIPAFWKFDKISISPSFSTVFGNEDIVIQFEGNLREELRTNEYLRQEFGSAEFRADLNSLLSDVEFLIVRNIQNNQQLNIAQKRNRILEVYSNSEQIQEYLSWSLSSTDNSAGIMNYNFSVPISFSFDNFMTTLSYNYNIPIKLPGEVITYDPTGYFGASISYKIPFR